MFYRVLEGSHLSFVESVPFKTIASFTLLQFAYFLLCFGVTWIPVAGILFPLPFFLLISIREHILPKFFQHNHLQELDASEYEEIAGARRRAVNLTAPVSLVLSLSCLENISQQRSLKKLILNFCFYCLPRKRSHQIQLRTRVTKNTTMPRY